MEPTVPSINERNVIWIYTTVDGVPDIIFENEEIPKVDQNQPHFMRRYSPNTLSEAFRSMGCQQPLSGSLSDWMFNFLRHCPLDQISIILGAGSENLFNNKRTYSSIGKFVVLTRMQFHRLACASLHVHQFRKIRYAVDFRLVLDFMEDRRFFIILLCGAPGTGKSTIASLLASRMSVNHILSTDSIRHAMRTFYPKDKYPILYKSTYECGDVVDPNHELSDTERCIKGYLAQSELVGNQLNSIISTFVKSHASLIVEGVHLSIDVILKLVQQFPNIIPFLIYIKKEDFHRQRFAVRAKYMTTDPSQNRYISHFDAIRCVQNYLSEGASQHLLPKIDNRNIDRSMETMHQTIFSYLKKLEGRKSMYDESTQKLTFLDSVWKRRKQKMTSKSKSLKAINTLKKAQFEEVMMVAYKLNREKTSTDGEIADENEETEVVKYKEFVQNFLNSESSPENENSPENVEMNIDLNGLTLNGLNIDVNNLSIDSQLLEHQPSSTMNHELENQKYYDELMAVLPEEGKKITSEDIDGNFFQFLKNGSMLMMHDKEAAEKKRKENEEAEIMMTSPKSNSSKSISTGVDIQLILRHSSSPVIGSAATPNNNEHVQLTLSSESSNVQSGPTACGSIDNSSELLLNVTPNDKTQISNESPEVSETSQQITSQLLHKKKNSNLVIANEDGSFTVNLPEENEIHKEENNVIDENETKKEEMNPTIVSDKSEDVDNHEELKRPENEFQKVNDFSKDTEKENENSSMDKQIGLEIEIEKAENTHNDVTFNIEQNPNESLSEHKTTFSFDNNLTNGQSEYSDGQIHFEEQENGISKKKFAAESDRYNDTEFQDTETDLDPAEVTLTDFVETTDSEAVDWKSVFAGNLGNLNPLYANAFAQLQMQRQGKNPEMKNEENEGNDVLGEMKKDNQPTIDDVHLIDHETKK